MRYRRILVAYDGSRASKQAIEKIIGLVSFSNATIYLLAVLSVPRSLFLMHGPVGEADRPDEEARLQQVLDEGVRNLTERGFETTGRLVTGEPITEICRAAAEVNADLIVVGHQQNSSWVERLWEQSIGAQLLDQAPTSVLISVSAKSPPSSCLDR